MRACRKCGLQDYTVDRHFQTSSCNVGRKAVVGHSDGCFSNSHFAVLLEISDSLEEQPLMDPGHESLTNYYLLSQNSGKCLAGICR
ncbi:hypothetical protein Zmor_000694 [Zophobas morio]|uniref:Uncharacterized protein n=1 Tax=Zophobas morio TaxID=2755281 RepID=A0AA38J389_9CUCU|nr:hypothetical protein Zmor_009151 [Zophobas morio]KAJ3665186.1 hypothetical protein Zmor_000694 [Zophobas morio]